MHNIFIKSKMSEKNSFGEQKKWSFRCYVVFKVLWRKSKLSQKSSALSLCAYKVFKLSAGSHITLPSHDLILSPCPLTGTAAEPALGRFFSVVPEIEPGTVSSGDTSSWRLHLHTCEWCTTTSTWTHTHIICKNTGTLYIISYQTAIIYKKAASHFVLRRSH